MKGADARFLGNCQSITSLPFCVAAAAVPTEFPELRQLAGSWVGVSLLASLTGQNETDGFHLHTSTVDQEAL